MIPIVDGSLGTVHKTVGKGKPGKNWDYSGHGTIKAG